MLLLLLSRFSRVRLCATPPGSPVPGILQARTLEWVAISFSNKFYVRNLLKTEYLQLPKIHMLNTIPWYDLEVGTLGGGSWRWTPCDWISVLMGEKQKSNELPCPFHHVSTRWEGMPVKQEEDHQWISQSLDLGLPSLQRSEKSISPCKSTALCYSNLKVLRQKRKENFLRVNFLSVFKNVTLWMTFASLLCKKRGHRCEDNHSKVPMQALWGFLVTTPYCKSRQLTGTLW